MPLSAGDQYDKIAPQYLAAKAKFLATASDFARHFVTAHLTECSGKTLLDVGCGAGDELVAYEQKGLAEVHGIDPSEAMLKEARQKTANPQYIKLATTEDTGYRDSSFDFVVGRFSLHYLEDLDAGYRELARILRPGALLIMIASHPLADALVQRRSKKNGRDYVTISIYEQIDITYPLHSLGEYFSPVFFEHFDLVDIQEYTEPHGDITVVPNGLGFAARRRSG